MTGGAEIEVIIRDACDARKRGDLDAMRETFTGVVRFDLFQVRDGRTSSLIAFCDTARAARMMAAPPR